ncbi:hypothetical protein [Polyangium sp. 15x6]|uniref:hypothetical protein n=1 Tax=Polyangium sp. 15x6 TaxID=3042687 RepID=UPI00249A7B06|nr:hypothetical protein [Polyangium sp. 15x6]MDI3292193.1 hypothetical protein [Polyangium sp. 15x6]
MNGKFLFVAMMGLGIPTVGCSQMATNEELAALDLVGYAPQENPTGGGTSNHLAPHDYHSLKYKLLDAMGHALATRSCSGTCYPTHALSADIPDTELLDTFEGQELFKIAIECALPEGEYVVSPRPPPSGRPSAPMAGATCAARACSPRRRALGGFVAAAQ